MGSDLRGMRGEGIGITKSWLSGGERAFETLLFFLQLLVVCANDTGANFLWVKSTWRVRNFSK